MQPDFKARDAPLGPHATARAFAELSSDGILLCADSQVVHANSVAAALLGREGDVTALLGVRLDALLTPAPTVTNASPGLVNVLGSRRDQRVEVRSAVLDGVVMHVLVDPGEQSLPHDALVDTSRDLLETRLESAALRSRVDAEVEERRELVAVVAHELRTPITVIRGYARLLLAGKVGELNAEQAEFIAASAQSCDRLDNFVEMLTDATDAQRAADAYHSSDASIEMLLAGVVEFMRPLIDESGMRVELELAPDALWAHFDAARVEQVLVNLIQNGLKYASEGQVLTVRTRRVEVEAAEPGDAADVEVSVSDRGPGIEAEQRLEIFDPYVRGESAATVPGLGLGLGICRRIVEAHGGSLDLSEEPGGGCRFAFTLAAAEPKELVEHTDVGNPGER